TTVPGTGTPCGSATRMHDCAAATPEHQEPATNRSRRSMRLKVGMLPARWNEARPSGLPAAPGGAVVPLREGKRIGRSITFAAPIRERPLFPGRLAQLV